MPAPFEPQRYGPVVAELLTEPRLPELGPGKAGETHRPALARLSPETLLAPAIVRDRFLAAACLAGLWLHFDFLNESHAISQELSLPEGSYWHGIMHRREPDPDNARYWFRRLGRHRVFPALLAEARRLAVGQPSDRARETLLARAAWEPFEFIELCESARGGRSANADFCRHVQWAEWRLLFDACWRGAVGETLA